MEIRVFASARHGYPGDCAGVGDREEDGASVPRGPRRPALRPACTAANEVCHRSRRTYVSGSRPRDRDWIPATVLLRELQERGYAGGISQLKVFVAPFKRARPDPVVRFETTPGEQLQADFTYVRKGQGRAARVRGDAGLQPCDVREVHAGRGGGDAVSSACARRWRTSAVCRRRILFDNPKTVVIERDAYGEGAAPVPPGSAGASRASTASGSGCAGRTGRRRRARSSGSTDS